MQCVASHNVSRWYAVSQTYARNDGYRSIEIETAIEVEIEIRIKLGIGISTRLEMGMEFETG